MKISKIFTVITCAAGVFYLSTTYANASGAVPIPPGMVPPKGVEVPGGYSSYEEQLSKIVEAMPKIIPVIPNAHLYYAMVSAEWRAAPGGLPIPTCIVKLTRENNTLYDKDRNEVKEMYGVNPSLTEDDCKKLHAILIK